MFRYYPTVPKVWPPPPPPLEQIVISENESSLMDLARSLGADSEGLSIDWDGDGGNGEPSGSLEFRESS